VLVLGLLAIQVSEANAAACAAGPHRAGCGNVTFFGTSHINDGSSCARGDRVVLG
jgi:hypothetical protein